MFQKLIFFAVLAILWVLVIFNRKLKISIKNRDRDLASINPDGGWSTSDCTCGTGRASWRAAVMNRPDNKVLLVCPVCSCLWEEHMSLYGNKWRPVDETYAREQYYRQEDHQVS